MASESRPPIDPQLRLAPLIRRRSSSDVCFSQLAGASDVQLLYGARFAIYHALQLSAPTQSRSVLVPSFHCPSIIDPILHAGHIVRFYKVHRDLTIDLEDFASRLDSDIGAAILVRYFGLPGNVDQAISLCREYRVLSIDDAAHSFLAANPTGLTFSGADATVYSFKKLLPTVVGGGIRFGDGWRWRNSVTTTQPRVSAARLKKHLSIYGSANAVSPPLDLSRHEVMERLARATAAIRRPAVVSYPYEPSQASSSMPATSRFVLKRSLLNCVIATRRRNFMLYSERLQTIANLRPICRRLPDEACPWGFPLILPNRHRHDYRLRALGVPLFTFGETLHPLADHASLCNPAPFENAAFLSENLVVLSVHQDLTAGHVERYAEIISAYMARFDSAG